MIQKYICIIILLVADLAVNAQADSTQQWLFNQLYSVAETKYGIPQELINGRLFEKRNQDAIGHPFFLDYNPQRGSVLYRGRKYSNQLMNYNIFDQQVLLTYWFDTIEYRLYLQKEFITEFTIRNKKFIQEALGTDDNAKFYQVIGGDGPCRILYYWSKYLNNLDRKVLHKNNIFSSAEKKTFLLLNNNLIGFKGNRSFTKIFTGKNKADIKEYLRKNKTKVKYADDHEMEKLVTFINTLDITGNK